MKKVLMNI